LASCKREFEITKIQLLADLRKEKEYAEQNLAKEISEKEDRINEMKIMHDAQVVETKDKLTRQIVELERKLQGLQQKYDDTTS
jgi:hypothetical protein